MYVVMFTIISIAFPAAILLHVKLMLILSLLPCSEFGEIDNDKVKAAVNTFMRSCAGYSVATYTLVRSASYHSASSTRGSYIM